MTFEHQLAFSLWHLCKALQSINYAVSEQQHNPKLTHAHLCNALRYLEMQIGPQPKYNNGGKAKQQPQQHDDF